SWRQAVAGSVTGMEGILELEQIISLCRAARYGPSRIEVSASVVRGLEYYTGPVYEAELTFEVAGEDGKPVRFGSVAGGGRYDGLVARFRGEPVPATGFSIGVSRLLAALNVLGKADAQPARGPVVVLVMDADRIADYQAMVAVLRAAGIRAELYLGEGKMKPQMRYADKRNSVCVVIQGSNEREAGEVLIKDLIVGAELAAASPDRKAYLREQGEAQFAVKMEDLVAAVTRVLAKHGVAAG
ncbi:MAG: ATP phosphoribosyltransferase regulatory subunit, partial [Alsobacter sp.]